MPQNSPAADRAASNSRDLWPSGLVGGLIAAFICQAQAGHERQAVAMGEGREAAGGTPPGLTLVRRLVAGVILTALGLTLLGSQMPVRPVFGLALLLLWGATGLAVLAGRSWGRWLGLAVSSVGLGVALWEVGQANGGSGRFLADVPNFIWGEVALATMGFAALSGAAGVLLLRPIRRSVQADAGA